MKKAFSLTALLALCGLGVGVLASCQEIPAVYLGVEVEEEPPHEHSYDGGVVTKEATCTEEGVMTYTCSCGDSYTEAIPALGHDFSLTEYLTDGWYYVCFRCGEPGEALGEDADPLEGGVVNASTAAGLEAALDAVNNATGEEEVVITLTGDIEAEGLTISGSNVTLTGEGELTLTDSIEVSGSDVTLDGLTIDASSISYEDSETDAAGAIEITGASTVINGCTIVGGGGSESNDNKASILVVPEEGDSEVTISGCDISGAYRGVYVNRGENVDLTISECEIHAAYAFNITGNNSSSVITVSDCGLYGWTSLAAVGEASFTNCTFGFSESECTYLVKGGFRPYSDVTLTGCHFASFNTSGITLGQVGGVDQKNDTEDYLAIKSNNYGISVGNDNVKVILIDCTYEQSEENGGVTVATVSEQNVINILCDKGNQNFSSHSTSGFVFSLDAEATLWTLTALNDAEYGVPNTGDDN